MVYSVAYNCANESGSGRSMDSFPQYKTRLRNWLRNMNREQWKPTCPSKLCGRHFEEWMFDNSSSVGYEKKIFILTEDAVPAKFNKLDDAEPK